MSDRGRPHGSRPYRSNGDSGDAFDGRRSPREYAPRGGYRSGPVHRSSVNDYDRDAPYRRESDDRDFRSNGSARGRDYERDRSPRRRERSPWDRDRDQDRDWDRDRYWPPSGSPPPAGSREPANRQAPSGPRARERSPYDDRDRRYYNDRPARYSPPPRSPPPRRAFSPYRHSRSSSASYTSPPPGLVGYRNPSTPLIQRRPSRSPPRRQRSPPRRQRSRSPLRPPPVSSSSATRYPQQQRPYSSRSGSPASPRNARHVSPPSSRPVHTRDFSRESSPGSRRAPDSHMPLPIGPRALTGPGRGASTPSPIITTAEPAMANSRSNSFATPTAPSGPRSSSFSNRPQTSNSSTVSTPSASQPPMGPRSFSMPHASSHHANGTPTGSMTPSGSATGGSTPGTPVAPKAMINNNTAGTALPRTASGSSIPLSRRSTGSYSQHGQQREARLLPSIVPESDKEIGRLKKEYAKLEAEDKLCQERKRAVLAMWDRLERETSRETSRVEAADEMLREFGY